MDSRKVFASVLLLSATFVSVAQAGYGGYNDPCLNSYQSALNSLSANPNAAGNAYTQAYNSYAACETSSGNWGGRKLLQDTTAADNIAAYVAASTNALATGDPTAAANAQAAYQATLTAGKRRLLDWQSDNWGGNWGGPYYTPSSPTNAGQDSAAAYQSAEQNAAATNDPTAAANAQAAYQARLAAGKRRLLDWSQWNWGGSYTPSSAAANSAAAYQAAENNAVAANDPVAAANAKAAYEARVAAGRRKLSDWSSDNWGGPYYTPSSPTNAAADSTAAYEAAENNAVAAGDPTAAANAKAAYEARQAAGRKRS